MFFVLIPSGRCSSLDGGHLNFLGVFKRERSSLLNGAPKRLPYEMIFHSYQRADNPNLPPVVLAQYGLRTCASARCAVWAVVGMFHNDGCQSNRQSS